MRGLIVLTLFAALASCGCRPEQRGSSAAYAADERKPAPLYEGLGDHTRKITTSSKLAQRYFNQGLVWTYAFNHDEAIRSYTEAARIDPTSAMAWWGVALCNGPHINNPVMPPDRSKAAWDALEKARALASNGSPIEKALIKALEVRYAWPAPEDRHDLDVAYAAAMEKVWKTAPDDLDVATLYVESLMDLQPWDIWTHDGKPKARATEILSVLESVLARDPKHPGAAHLYIHACEAGPTPEKANAAAEALRNGVPAAGHLVHMPAHIDVQVGRWSQAADQNVMAMEADRRYREISPRQGFYRLYMAHNPHFLAFASMMEGRREAALKAAKTLIADIPKDYAWENVAIVDPYLPIIQEVLMRFGKWDEVLDQPAPDAHFPISVAMWHFTRGVAHAAKGEVDEARKEQKLFREQVARIPANTMMAINPAHKVMDIADNMLEGEIAFRERRIDDAVASLKKAVAIEDELVYMEPPDWIQPVRHTLGAVLVDAGRFSDAEQVYREDLINWPENGWSLHGLAKCLRARGADAEASEVEARFSKSWARADSTIGASCLCVKR